MRVNVDWLRDFVETDADVSALAERLTTVGLEVEAMLPVAGGFHGVVVAQVSACERHPDADRLRVCKVDDGDQVHTVVCGAPNVRSGLKVALARVGAVLPGDLKIKAATIRGVKSAGMLCSAAELGISDDSSGIIELADDAEIGTDLRAQLVLDDWILDVALTPNRGDCFSVIGIARELSAAGGAALTPPVIQPVPAMSADRFGVRVEAADGCARFVGRVIRNVASGRRSPHWLADRLRRAGLRPIHPVVDITNYVMLELGQPLHAYDLSRLDGEIIVRWARAAETLTLLDGREIGLAEDTVVIADRSGPIGLAGIMGGEATAVENTTADIFLEAAYFPPQALAGRARRHGLHTDASMRFERGVDPEGQVRAIERATALLMQVAGGEPGPVVETVSADHLPSREPIRLRGDRLASVLGQALPPHVVGATLQALGMAVEADGANAWTVIPPSFRFDLSIEEDLIEEVARLVGYDEIPAAPELSVSTLGHATESRVDEERIADVLVARGYSEVITYSFIDPDLAEAINPGAPQQRLANPISRELGVMRRSLWPGLLIAAEKNLSRQQERVRIFEIGTQFEAIPGGDTESSVLAGLICGPRWPEHWSADSRAADFFDAKADVEALVALTHREAELHFVVDEHPALRPGRCGRILLAGSDIGWVGELHPLAQSRFGLKSAPIVFTMKIEPLASAKIAVFRSYSKFPSLRRDIAVVVGAEVSAEQVLRCVTAAAGDCLQNVSVFDLYRGPGIDSSRKSIGLGLILQDTYRTLTDEDADRTVAAVVDSLGSELGATIRN